MHIVKCLGVTLSQNLNWKDHVKYRLDKCIKVFWQCRKIIGKKWGLRPYNILWLYKAIVRPMLVYGSFVWWEVTKTVTVNRQLDHLQRVACLAITGGGAIPPHNQHWRHFCVFHLSKHTLCLKLKALLSASDSLWKKEIP